HRGELRAQVPRLVPAGGIRSLPGLGVREIGEREKRLKGRALCDQAVVDVGSSPVGNRGSGRGTSLHSEPPRRKARRPRQELPPPERKRTPHLSPQHRNRSLRSSNAVTQQSGLTPHEPACSPLESLERHSVTVPVSRNLDGMPRGQISRPGRG